MAVMMDMGRVALDMQNGYGSYQQPEAMEYQQADATEPPPQRLQRLQAEAAQLAAEQSQVGADYRRA